MKSQPQSRRAAWDPFPMGTPDVLWHGTSQYCLNLDVVKHPIWWCNLCSFCFSFLLMLVYWKWAYLIAQLAKNPPAMQVTPVQFLGQEDSLEKG